MTVSVYGFRAPLAQLRNDRGVSPARAQSSRSNRTSIEFEMSPERTLAVRADRIQAARKAGAPRRTGYRTRKTDAARPSARDILHMRHEPAAEPAPALIRPHIEPVQFGHAGSRKIDRHAGADPAPLVVEHPERAAVAGESLPGRAKIRQVVMGVDEAARIIRKAERQQPEQILRILIGSPRAAAGRIRLIASSLMASHALIRCRASP